MQGFIWGALLVPAFNGTASAAVFCIDDEASLDDAFEVAAGSTVDIGAFENVHILVDGFDPPGPFGRGAASRQAVPVRDLRTTAQHPGSSREPA